MENDKNQQSAPADVEGDRGLPSVTSRKRGGSALSKVGMAAIGIVALLAILAVNGVFSREEKTAGPGPAPKKEQQAKVVRSTLPALPPPPVKKVSAPPEPAEPIVPAVIRTSEVAPPQPRFTVIEDKEKTITPAQRKRESGLFASYDSQSSDKVVNTGGEMLRPDQVRMMGAPESGPQDESARDKGSLSSRLETTQIEGARASLLPDRNLIVTRGTFIDCALETAISSDVPGFLSCRVTRDIYSTSGRVLLVERGSKVVGQYQGGLQRGQSRIFALWDRIETPNGVIVSLESPGTDALGRSGHEGYVDKHFWERFGGAILLSVIDDLGNTAAAAASENEGVQIGSTTGAAQEAASIALENSINIPPTLYKNQGEHISIFVARDLDFSPVYDLQPAGY